MNLDNYIWLEKRQKIGDDVVQQQKKLVDMPPEELINAYEHCKKMLYNQSSETPGRYGVLKLISEQRDKCGVELFLRYLDKERKMSRFSLLEVLKISNKDFSFLISFFSSLLESSNNQSNKSRMKSNQTFLVIIY
jgi:hypothetical protein